MKKNYDVIIMGGGLVGSVLALALSKYPLQIALVEQRSFALAPPIDTGASKPIALNYASIAILKNLGLWSAIASMVSPIHAVHISEQGTLASAKIQAQAIGVSTLGHVISAAQLAWKLTQALRHASAQGNIDLWNPARCQGLNRHAHGWEVTIQTDTTSQTLDASLVIATDGVNSTARQLMGISLQKKNEAFKTQALVTTLHTSKLHDQVAYQRFTQQGILAFLPLLRKNRVGLVWTAPEMTIQTLIQLDDADFLARLHALFPKRLGSFSAKEAVQAHTLETFIAKKQAEPGFILLGNAAHTFSPIAAQGLNLALHDMAVLVDQIWVTLDAKKPLSHPSLTEQYLQQRLPAQRQIMSFTQRLTQIFSPRVQGLTLLRNSGLLVFDFIPLFKKTVSRRLMGIQGRLPTLIRGTVTGQQEEIYAEI